MTPFNMIVFLLVLVVGGILLQIFLSAKKNKWLGLILPLLCLLFALLPILSLAAYTTPGELTMQQFAPDGTVMEESIIAPQEPPTVHIGAVVLQVCSIFVLYNIPTAILLAIYFACKEKLKKANLLEKMNIQDLG